jgi:hypothetical protein
LSSDSAFFSSSGKSSLIASFTLSSSFVRSVGEGPNHASRGLGPVRPLGPDLAVSLPFCFFCF